MSNPVSLTRYGLDRIRKRKEIADRYNLNFGDIIDLSGGDNLFIPPKLIHQIIIKEIQTIDPRDSYPIDYSSYLDEIGRFIDVDHHYLYPGFSHNLLAQRLISTFTEPKDSVIIVSPEKSIYQKIAKNRQLNTNIVELTDGYELDLDAIFSSINDNNPSAIMFSSPHYPTGNQFKEQDILSLAKETTIPIIVDESYVEFGKYSLVNQVEYYDNLNIIRSFSKAWGLGAFSSAYLVADTKVIQRLTERYIIEEIPPIHLLATTYVLQNPYRFVELIQNFLQERKRVYEHLGLLNGLTTFRSDTNFIFMKFPRDNAPIFDYLCSKGIIIQQFDSSYDFKGREKSFLVTLGTQQINERFIISLIEALEALLE